MYVVLKYVNKTTFTKKFTFHIRYNKTETHQKSQNTHFPHNFVPCRGVVKRGLNNIICNDSS